MTVLLATHAELFRNKHFGNPPHTRKGLNRMRAIVKMILAFIGKDAQKDGLTVLLMGEGNKYEDMLLEFKNQSSSRFESHIILGQGRPDIITGMSWMLGGASSRRSDRGDMIYSPGGNPYYRDHCDVLYDCISVDDAWRYVEKKDTQYEGYKIFCSGRQLMTALGFKEHFSIASVFALNWHNRKLQCIIKNGKQLIDSIA